MDNYVAIPGLAFSIRVTLARPGTEGVLYGARVYCDSGDGSDTTVYTHWSSDDEDEEVEEVEEEEDPVDKSKADHYFWFQPGQTKHIIHGFL